MKSIILTIIITGLVSSAKAQALPSEKPVSSLYSKTTAQKLKDRDHDRQPAARNARQELPVKKDQRLASERPVDNDKIKRQRARKRPR